MYRIQGSDNKEYGPVPAEMVRQWIGERRMNQATLACLEGEGVWKPLGQFAEFADLFAGSAVAVAAPGAFPAYSAAGPSTPVDPAEARRAVAARLKAPAILLIIVAVLSIGSLIVSSIMTLQGKDPGRAMFEAIGIKLPTPPPEQLAMQEKITKPLTIGQLVVGIPWNIVIVLGALRMMKVRSHGLALTAAILGVIPCCSFCCLSLPFGIWALVLLLKPEVKSQFTQ